MQVVWDLVRQNLGDLIGATVAVTALLFAIRQHRSAERAKQTDFHVFVRKVGRVTASDHPIDRPGHWVVISNGTGAPVSEWSVDVSLVRGSERDEIYEGAVSSALYGPIPPTQSRLVAFEFRVEAVPEGADLKASQWSFVAGADRWRRDRHGGCRRLSRTAARPSESA